MEQTRYYYKTQDGKGLLSLKHRISDPNYIEITKTEFDELANPTEESEGN